MTQLLQPISHQHLSTGYKHAATEVSEVFEMERKGRLFRTGTDEFLLVRCNTHPPAAHLAIPTLPYTRLPGIELMRI